MVIKTDKNLGPAIIDRKQYIERAFQDHLCNKETYQRLQPSAARLHVKQLKSRIITFLELHFPENHPDRVYLSRKLESVTDPFAYFYVLAKIHKTPWSTRPIVSVSGSLLEGLGKWCDVQLQNICRNLPYIFRSAYCVKSAIEELQANNPSLIGVKLFTADAVSMYTNIDTVHALESIHTFLTETRPDIPAHHNIDVKTLVNILELIMTNTVFKFGDTFWIQESGTAMGSPAAPMYATLYFLIHEISMVTRYPSLILYGRYIDDIFGIWMTDETPATTLATFDQFKSECSSYGSLRWEFDTLSESVTFLDITIYIDKGTIVVRPYEKHLNLYLYIPPRSAHPPHGLHSLISGRITHIQRITTCKKVFRLYLNKLRTRLLSRGYSDAQILPAFVTAIQKPPYKTQQPQPNRSLHTPCVFLHYQHHPGNVPAKKIQHLLSETLLQPEHDDAFKDLHGSTGNKINLDKITICHHRPKNLGHFLSPRKFPCFFSIKKSLYHYTQHTTPPCILAPSLGVNKSPCTHFKKVRFNPYPRKHTPIGNAHHESARSLTQPENTSISGNTPQPHNTTLIHNQEIYNPYTRKHIILTEPRFPNPPALPHAPTPNTLTVRPDPSALPPTPNTLTVRPDPSALPPTPNTLRSPVYFNPYKRFKTTGKQAQLPNDTAATVHRSNKRPFIWIMSSESSDSNNSNNSNHSPS
jgi:hypothetical protein